MISARPVAAIPYRRNRAGSREWTKPLPRHGRVAVTES
jgi:hypothetical protein